MPPFDDRPSLFAPVVAQVPDEGLVAMAARTSRLVRLGPCGWGFAHWRGTLYGAASGTRRLHGSQGLAALARSPLIRCVSLERGYLHPYACDELRTYADAVPADFRFMVRAPAMLTSVLARDRRGRAEGLNPHFLDQGLAQHWLDTCVTGLGERLGVLLFDMGPYPSARMKSLAARHEAVDRLHDFFETFLTSVPDAVGVTTALEVRNPTLLTPRLIDGLRELGVRPVLGLTAGMPGILRQMRALAYCDGGKQAPPDWQLQGPLVIRWQHAAGMERRFVGGGVKGADPVTRAGIASLVMRAVRSGQPAYVVAGDDAEGSAPETLRAILTSVDSVRREIYQRERG